MNSELKPILDKIVELLKIGYNVKALILCGSHCVGDYNPTSDWDLKAFVEDPKRISKENPPPKIDGVKIDCTFHKLDTSFSWDEFGKHLKFSEVIFDNKNQIAKTVRNQAIKEYEKSLVKWTKHIALLKIEKVRRYENKFEEYLKDNNQAELFQHIAWHFLENTYSWWYSIRREWEPRSQEIFADIKKRDPQFYKYLQRIFTSTTNEEKIKALHDLHKYFFNSKEFQRLIN